MHKLLQTAALQKTPATSKEPSVNHPSFTGNNSEKLVLCKVAREKRGSRELDDEGASARSCARSAEQTE